MTVRATVFCTNITQHTNELITNQQGLWEVQNDQTTWHTSQFSGEQSQQILNNIGINPVSITRIKFPLSRYTNVWCHN